MNDLMAQITVRNMVQATGFAGGFAKAMGFYIPHASKRGALVLLWIQSCLMNIINAHLVSDAIRATRRIMKKAPGTEVSKYDVNYVVNCYLRVWDAYAEMVPENAGLGWYARKFHKECVTNPHSRYIVMADGGIFNIATQTVYYLHRM